MRFPEGVTVLSTPKLCGVPNSRKRTHYRCEYGLCTSGFEVPVLRDGFHVDYPFKVRIDDPSKLTGGMIRVDAPPERLRGDADPRNSTAPLTIEAAGAAGGFGPTAWAVAAGAAAAVLTGLLALGRRRRRSRHPCDRSRPRSRCRVPHPDGHAHTALAAHDASAGYEAPS
ncbi:hypothetical protein AB0C13_28250 [Streptomyces sp. NPDC049099]|uniref:hypothetical protein n=1 Tax=Streptomyces sp. NPDC049099 TaxID=3155768 RepID=UPI003425C576